MRNWQIAGMGIEDRVKPVQFLIGGLKNLTVTNQVTSFLIET